jgi:hypothetical protein
VRKLGDITLDMEKLLLELTEEHDLQHGEILNLIRGYLEIHCPLSREEYIAGGHPEFYYGPPRSKNERRKRSKD